MKRKRQPKPNKWEQLGTLIAEYAEAYVADSWKGGGDPESIPLIEAQLEVARLKLEEHIRVMRRDEE